ncbi:MAG: D-Ala-D-Ala carboxypeptidase family metallohydrolase [Pseudomonadota bacterium]|nr:D-Ala-D-Ala carboxypeptidase family metallohydrolase [Pseudomonadota bacterium]
MLTFLRSAALAATLSLVPAASLNSAPSQAEVRPAAVVTATASPAAQKPAPAPLAEFGLDAAHDHEHDSGLAPGQTAEDFQAWVRRSPANFEKLGAFHDYLAAQHLESVVPMWQLVRTSSSWRQCGAEPFEVPPADKWGRIVKTLRFVRDEVVPAVGAVETLSAYRNAELNACSDGAPKSAHREFFALDLTPVDAAVERAEMIRDICAAHARDGQAYDAGLGFYTGRRFHVDSSGFRKWGPNGKGATSPCAGYA